ncbi:sensor histidine kinase [Mucilaginibacter sp. FT3.2]|uniref:sensor histidine kinase n=1 Tax=Mucilaginibacter sp. FT3.2 TaxID=2723090 RepID=UPI001622D5B9|nr:histidine kinase [Mucilaginibacter sp. FT3.2]MBB6230654.1 sensor histidine kinase YesM [Mucilaginibacter sp. FT3.2]
MKSKLLLYHASAWVIFILYEISISILLGASKNLWGYFPYYVIHITWFYSFIFLCRYAVDHFKRWWLFLIPVTLLVFVVYVLLIIITRKIFIDLHLSDETFKLDHVLFTGVIWRGIYFLLISSTYCLVFFLINKINENNRLKIKQLETEKEWYKLDNAYLLSQVNQHLLFNTLNFIYNAVRKASPDAAQSVMMLSSIMRHSLGGTGPDGKIGILDEIEHIEQLIEISRLRFGKRAFIDFEVNIDRELRFPPLILVTFVENVLKHGNFTLQEHPAIIYLEINATQLLFRTSNLKKNTQLEYSSKIGIKNAELRLASAFGAENYTLIMNDEGTLYNVNLAINL